ncbi:hypothetical protein [Rhizobium tumorigenes]|uniref:hypothetical protein n=1 Tax=Rhizobium tumorigenes TaxID=2041385 RepID=UPI00241EE1BF|nr:hypothetical protein [Rhizobium tumorigenes]WFS02222.1 hypothetical protein PR016_06305 [Rhizobium tumorigenes]
MMIGDAVHFYCTYARLWRGQTGPMKATVQTIASDGALNLFVECGEPRPRYVQNVLPRDQGEDHFWYDQIPCEVTTDEAAILLPSLDPADIASDQGASAFG